MSKQAAVGIQNILDGILSPENRQTSKLAQRAAVESPSSHETHAKATVDERRPPPVGARRGRPLGQPSAAAQPKTKVTLWLSSGLVASYREWSWEARSQFSHLSEKALADHYGRQHNLKSAKR
jgi:uncharacterized protein (DUF4415 family)